MTPDKILLVHYLPRGAHSNTKALVDEFRSAAAGRPIEDLDLAAHPPAPFLPDSIQAYIEGHYLGQTLSPAAAAAIAPFRRLAAQVRAAGTVVLASPMHNFSLPAAVKAWFDAVMLKGETWDIGPNGFAGLMGGRRALVLMSSGGRYEGPMAGWDHAMSLARQEFQFMGFSDIRHVWASGLNNPACGNPDEIVVAARAEVRRVAEEWFNHRA